MNYETSLLSNNELKGKNYFSVSQNGVNIHVARDGEGKTPAVDSNSRVVAEETRELLRQYLERSLIQSSKTSFRQSEGYHHLKRDGKLSYYQRQQSRPEQGVLVRRESNSGRFGATISSHGSFKLARNEVTKLTTSEEINFTCLTDDAKQQCIENAETKQSFQALEASDKKEIRDTTAQSSDSMSGDEDLKYNLRRKSFSRAVGRKSVISFIENRQKDKKKQSQPNESLLPRSFAENHALCESGQLDVSMTEDSRPLQVSDDTTRSRIDEKNSLSVRLKKVMPSTSNKKKLKSKKSLDAASVDELGIQIYRSSGDKDEPSETDISVVRRSSSLKRKPIPSDASESSVSPPKSKLSFPPKQLLRSTSNRSPKGKRRSSVEQQVTSNSLNALNGLGVKSKECFKTNSLPLSARYSTKKEVCGRKSTDKNVCDGGSHKRKSSPDDQRDRPGHLDLSGKKKSKSKVTRFFRSLLKRHPRSSNSAEMRFHPSAAEEKKHHDKEENKYEKTADKAEDRVDGGGDVGMDPHKPYHHRGSLSFSPGDKLSSEKRKVFEKFVETLDRVSSHYSQHINSCSVGSGSRINTPDSCHSSSEYLSHAKASRSEPPLRQLSSVSAKYTSSVLASGKSFRQFKDGSRPALAAFHNIKTQQNNLDQTRGAKKRSILRRHTHHTHSAWMGLRLSNERHRKLETPPPAGSPSDVVDGVPFTTSVHADCYISRKTSSSSEDMDVTEDLVDSRKVESLGETDNSLPPASIQDLFRPSTSAGHDRVNGFPPSSEVDVDGLVREIARCIRTQGDIYNTSVNNPDIPIEPLRDQMSQYLREQTYPRFHDFAQLFFNHLTETPSARNQDALSFVVAWNMSRFICNLFTSSDGGVFSHILKHSTQFVMDMMENTPTPLPILTAQLQATEEEISQCESLSDSPFDVPYFYEVD